MEDDKTLIKRAQKGESDAFEKIYNKYFQKIYRYCRINTNNEELAKDICQESFVKAWKKLKDFKMEGQWSIQAFLFTIARNQIIDHSRKKKDLPLDEYENITTSEDLYHEVDKRQDILRVKKILSKLDETDRQIVLLRYFEEMSSGEVANILGIKDGSLRVRTFRVMHKLKDIFEALYGQRN
jgi:RNA polymerase sigma-70 factor (ECF subfamily)